MKRSITDNDGDIAEIVARLQAVRLRNNAQFVVLVAGGDAGGGQAAEGGGQEAAEGAEGGGHQAAEGGGQAAEAGGQEATVGGGQEVAE